MKQYSATLNNPFLNFERYRERIDMLKARKRRLFGNDSRIIRETILRYDEKGELRVNVVSEVDFPSLKKVLERAKEELAAQEDGKNA